jgi:hypothetical protein
MSPEVPFLLRCNTPLRSAGKLLRVSCRVVLPSTTLPGGFWQTPVANTVDAVIIDELTASHMAATLIEGRGLPT